MVHIEQFDRESKGFFKAVDENGETAGRMTYSWAGSDRFIIDHTEVDEKFGGQGIGKKLVMAAVTFAREKGLKIIPLCPFAKRIFDITPDIHDVLIAH